MPTPHSVPSVIQRQRRDEIITAAITSMAESGYLTTSFAEIGRRVGISKSVIAYHFKTKEALIDAMVNAIYDKGFAEVRPAIDAEATAQGKIEAFIRHSIRFYQEYRPYVMALSSLRLHLSNKGAPNATAIARLHKELADVAAILRAGQKTGEFGAFSAPVAARMLRQTLDGVLIEMTHHPDLDLEAYADQLVILCKKALQKEEKA